MKGRLRVVAVSSVLVALAFACGAYSADEPGLPARADGGPITSDGSSGEDALAEVVTDGGGDADAGPSSCKTTPHTFCDDFDEQALGAIWTGKQFAFPGAAQIEDAAAVSPPNALAVVTNADGGGAETFLSHKLPGPFMHAVAEADIRIERKPTVTQPTIGLLEIAIVDTSSTANWHLRVHEYAGKTEVLEAHFGYPDGGSNYRFSQVGTPNQRFPLDVWTHVKIDVTVRPGDLALATVTIGGSLVFDGALGQVWKPGSVEIYAGAYAQVWGGGVDWKVRIDNVSLDAN